MLVPSADPVAMLQDPLIILISPHELERKLLCLLFATSRLKAVVEACNEVTAAAGILKNLGNQANLGAILIDDRIYSDNASAGVLSAAIRNRQTRSQFLLLHYSAFTDPIVRRSAISSIEGYFDSTVVDRRSQYWVQEAVSKVIAYCHGLNLLAVRSSLDTERPTQIFPVRSSITSELLVIRALAQLSTNHPHAQFEAARFAGLQRAQPNLFRHSQFVAEITDWTFQKGREEFTSRGLFKLHSWSSRSSTFGDLLYKKRLATLLDDSLHNLQSTMGINQSEDRSSLLVWLWHNPPRGQNPRIPADPFVDSCDDPLTLVFPQFPDAGLLSPQKLEDVVNHEIMHIFNRKDRPQIPIDWIWFDEALANWYALRKRTILADTMLENLPIDSLENRFAGLLFAIFLEARLGPKSLRAIWRTKVESVFSATSSIGGISANDLILEFYTRALVTTHLQTSGDTDTATTLPHTAYRLLPTLSAGTIIDITCHGQPWHQVYLIVRGSDQPLTSPAAIRIQKLSPTGTRRLLLERDSTILLANVGCVAKPNAFNDDALLVQTQSVGGRSLVAARRA